MNAKEYLEEEVNTSSKINQKFINNESTLLYDEPTQEKKEEENETSIFLKEKKNNLGIELEEEEKDGFLGMQLAFSYDHYFHFPYGSYNVLFNKDNVTFTQVICFGCYPDEQKKVFYKEIKEINIYTRSSKGCCCALDIFFILIMAIKWSYFFHLIPAEIIGIEVVLGSAEMHRNLGIVWLVLGLLFLLALILIKCYFSEVVIITDRDGKDTIIPTLHTSLSVPLKKIFKNFIERYDKDSKEEGLINNYGSNKNNNNLNLATTIADLLKRFMIARIILKVVLVCLVINLIVVLVLIEKCKKAGGCQY